MGMLGKLGLAAVVALASGLTAQGQCDQPTYPGEYIGEYLPSYPYGSVPADLNGDGAAEIVAAVGSTVQIYLNAGEGNLALADEIDGFGEPFPGSVWVLPADLDGDGDTDLAVISGPSDDLSLTRVYVGLNQGDATFVDGGSFWVGEVQSGVCGDYDGDGDVDLAFVTSDVFSAACLLNDGGGGFSAPVVTTIGVPSHVANAGDFNNDGSDDLVVYQEGSSDQVVIALSQGAGDFRLLSPLSLDEGQSERVTVADFNEDGNADLAIGHRTHKCVDLFLGQGDGTFAAGEAVDLPEQVFGIDAGDFDRDGHIDLAIRIGFFDYERGLSIYFGDGTGALDHGETYPCADGAYPIAVDLNGDSADDLLIRSRESYVMLNDGQGRFLTPVRHEREESMTVLGLRDVDADGDVDVLVGAGGNGPPQMLAFLNTGNGTLVPEQSTTIEFGSAHMSLGNLNGDAFPDLAVAHFGIGVSTYLGIGDGTFADRLHYEGIWGLDLALDDFDADGLDDLYVATDSDPLFGTLMLNQGDGTMGPITDSIDWGPGPVRVADLDGDGDADLLLDRWELGAVEFAVALSNGDGTFTDPVVYEIDTTHLPYTRDLALADLDGDADFDVVLAWAEQEDISWEIYNHLTIALNEGNGTFVLGDRLDWDANAHPPSPLIVADFDGDGDDDLAYGQEDDVYIHLYDGTGSLEAPLRLFGGLGLLQADAADLNGNDRPDLVTLNSYDAGSGGEIHFLGVLLSQCPAVCIGDLDGDGDTDQADLGVLLAAYNNDDGGDLNGDGFTDQADLGILLADYGC